MKGINLQIQEFKENLLNVINESKLPPAIVQMALGELTAQVDRITEQALEKERQAYEKTQEGEITDGQEICKD